MTSAPLTQKNKLRFLNCGIKLIFACAFGFLALSTKKFLSTTTGDWTIFALSCLALIVMALFIWSAALSVRATHQNNSDAT